jgi:transcriptional regulator with XRE-family HTH domain
MPISHVADRCGLAHSYFWQLLRGEASASLAVVQRLADALGVRPLVLLGAAADEPERSTMPLAAEVARRSHAAPKRKRRVRTTIAKRADTRRR